MPSTFLTFHVNSVLEMQRLPKQMVHDTLLRVQAHDDRLRHASQAGAHEDNLIVLSEGLEELVDAGALGVPPAVFSVPGGMDEGVLEVDNEGVRAGEVLGNVRHWPRGEEGVVVWFYEACDKGGDLIALEFVANLEHTQRQCLVNVPPQLVLYTKIELNCSFVLSHLQMISSKARRPPTSPTQRPSGSSRRTLPTP